MQAHMHQRALNKCSLIKMEVNTPSPLLLNVEVGATIRLVLVTITVEIGCYPSLVLLPLGADLLISQLYH